MTAIAYNTSNLTGNFVEVTTGLNQLSEGLFISMLLFVAYIILFLIARNNEGAKAGLVASSFIITVLASLAWFAGWISGWIVMIPLVAFIFGIFMIKLFD